jgi:hypothetical protein
MTDRPQARRAIIPSKIEQKKIKNGAAASSFALAGGGDQARANLFVISCRAFFTVIFRFSVGWKKYGVYATPQAKDLEIPRRRVGDHESRTTGAGGQNVVF